MDRINVLSDDIQIFGKKITFSTNFHWNDSKDYVMVFEQGVCTFYRMTLHRVIENLTIGLVTGNNSCYMESLFKTDFLRTYHSQTG